VDRRSEVDVGWLGPGRAVSSWFGWSVRPRVAIASRDQLTSLISTATRRGYSRLGVGLDPDDGHTFVVVPVLYEESPSPIWICYVVGLVHGLEPRLAQRPQFTTTSRLDVSPSDLSALGSARRRQRDQLLHWLIGEMARPLRRDAPSHD
jgi:hypothetical protein